MNDYEKMYYERLRKLAPECAARPGDGDREHGFLGEHLRKPRKVIAGFNVFLSRYKKALPMERTATEVL